MLLALLGPWVTHRWQGQGILLLAVGLCAAVVPVEWWRLRVFARANPAWSIPVSEVWNQSLWNWLAYALVAIALYGITRLPWVARAQVVAGMAVALLLPPVAALAGFFLSCFGFGQCP